jgi:prephenate dehydrogenase
LIITVVGLGVVGGSFVKALKGMDYDVYGIDTDIETLKIAKEEGYIIEGYTDGKEILAKSDFVMICLYPSLVLDFIKNNTFKKGSIISDAVGIKSYFLEEALKLIGDDVEYVSGHPMAGREKKGFAYASKEVFEGANYIIIEHEKNKKESIMFMQDFVSKLGFKSVKIMSPYDHDEIISFTSQLPHVIAVSLINSDTQKYDTGKYIGDSYRDLTRIANINEDLWSELFINNKHYLLQSIENFEKMFDKMKEAIINDDQETLKKYFIEATYRRENLEK